MPDLKDRCLKNLAARDERNEQTCSSKRFFFGSGLQSGGPPKDGSKRHGPPGF
jgi:hypothetical protein